MHLPLYRREHILEEKEDALDCFGRDKHMSDMIDLIKTRRSVRKYKADMVPQDKIDEIIEAGLYAASSKGQQKTIIVEVRNKEVRDKLSALNCKIGGWKPEFDPFYGAPVILIVLSPRDWPNREYDGSLVMGNMMLEAHSIGLGSVWIHRAKEEFELEEGKELLRSLGIEGEYEGIGHLAVGFPDGEAEKAAPRREGRVYHIE